MMIANALAFKFGIPNYRSSLKFVLPALDESLCQDNSGGHVGVKSIRFGCHMRVVTPGQFNALSWAHVCVLVDGDDYPALVLQSPAF